MKKSFILSLLLIGSLKALSCFFVPTTNYYIYRAYTQEATDGGLYDRMFKEWVTYAGEDNALGIYDIGSIVPKDFAKSDNPLLTTARQRGDRTMLAYLELLNTKSRCSNIIERMADKWDYPTKAEIAFAQKNLRNVLTQALAYKGTALRDRYLLMAMRTAFMLKNYAQATNAWTRLAKEPPSVYRDMGENLYAGILLRQGKRDAAIDIYARQGDWLSLQWLVRKDRNVAGISKIYNATPNSPLLRYLVQDFVDNVQETCDSRRASIMQEGDELNLSDPRRCRIYDKEVEQFTDFAQKVIAEGKTEDPAMWQSAMALIDFYYDHHALAQARSEKALTMKGTDVSKENARIVHLFTSTAEAKPTEAYLKYLKEELEWLDSRIYTKKNGELDTYFYNMRIRLFAQELDSTFKRWQRPDLACYALSKLDQENEHYYNIQANTSEKNSSNTIDWNTEPLNYWGYLMPRLREMSTNEVITFYEGLEKSSHDVLTKWLKQNTYRNNDFYNDYIGTRLLAQGNFEKAQPYLERTSLTYLSKQNIAFYASQRTYKKEAWIDPQWSKGSEFSDTTITLTRNQKLDFCRDIIATKRAYETANAGERSELAYQLANLYFQASPKGRCWYLASYYYGGDEGYNIEKKTIPNGHVEEKRTSPFFNRAKALLQEAALSRNLRLKEKSLFALAYLPEEEYLLSYEWCADINFTEAVNRKSPQWEALTRLATLSKQQKPSEYVSACGIYRAFLRLKS